MGNIISGIFGGGQKDDSAEKIAQAQIQAQEKAAAQEQARWQAEQTRISSDKAAAELKAKTDADTLSQQRKDAEIQNQKQIEAAKATGNPGFENTKNTAEKVVASGAGGIELPGYKTLSQLKATTAGGFQGQQNSLTSPTGFNNKNVGGRRYV